MNYLAYVGLPGLLEIGLFHLEVNESNWDENSLGALGNNVNLEVANRRMKYLAYAGPPGLLERLKAPPLIYTDIVVW